MTEPESTEPPSEPHPLRGEWRAARPALWGGHVSPQFLVLVLLLHAVALGWFAARWDRVRMLLYDYSEVFSEPDINISPDALASRWKYDEDRPEDLAVFREIATPLVSAIPDATLRARVLADYIYSLRSPAAGGFDEDVRFGPVFLLDRLRAGLHANCGQMSTVLASFWRSLGGHTRAVRWGKSHGEVGHYALELWDPERRRWFYYDMNLNGFGVDDDGVTPLSVASMRAAFLIGEDLHLRSNTAAQDYSQADLMATIREYPVEWYVLNNTYLDWSADRRFGVLNRFSGILTKLPHPWDRILDNLTGARDRRLLVEGRLTIDNVFTFRGARLFVSWLLLIIGLSGLTLLRAQRRARSVRA